MMLLAVFSKQHGIKAWIAAATAAINNIAANQPATSRVDLEDDDLLELVVTVALGA